MSWKNVNLIFRREVRDQLRDKRTLFMVVVLPLLLYPAMGIGMVQMTVTFSEQPRRAIVLGAAEIPEPSFLDENRIAADLLENPADASRLEFVTDEPGAVDRFPTEDRGRLNDLLAVARSRQPRLEQLRDVQLQLDRLQPDHPDASALQERERTLRQEFDSWFSETGMQAVVIFPQGFRARYEQTTAELIARLAGENATVEGHDPPQPLILHNSANEKSEIAFRRIRRALDKWQDVLLKDRLKQANLPASLPEPVPLVTIDLAEPAALMANVWSKLFPALLIVMSVTGAFYPAVDLGAGEKERGTMETLLISPASRTEIVMGKFFTVLLFSLTTAFLNLASMGFTGRHMIGAVGGGQNPLLGNMTIPPISSLMWVVLLAIPLASLFSALSLSIATFARSSKEGQYYLTPLLTVTLGLTIFCMSPGIELTFYYSMMPVVGPALLLKALLLGGNVAMQAAPYAIPVVMSSMIYSLLALMWATDQFEREDILFRESEQFDLRLWVRHLLREKERTPSVAEALVCFAIMLLLAFVFLMSNQSTTAAVDSASAIMATQLIFLVATVGAPAVFMALLLTTSARQTLKLRLPHWKYVACGVVLPLTLQPLSLTLMDWLDPFFPALPDSVKVVLGAMGEAPLWLSFAAIALAPAICEELAFRGFILSGLQRSRHRWAPIVMSALMFGVIHMIPKQQFHAALLGLVLGLLAIRSRSLWPGVIFHAIFNGTQVLLPRVPETVFRNPWIARMIRLEGTGAEANLQFPPVTLVVCGILSALLLWWLARHGGSSRNDSAENTLRGDSSGARLRTPAVLDGTEPALTSQI